LSSSAGLSTSRDRCIFTMLVYPSYNKHDRPVVIVTGKRKKAQAHVFDVKGADMIA
jgi:hypothetical protein